MTQRNEAFKARSRSSREGSPHLLGTEGKIEHEWKTIGQFLERVLRTSK